MALELRTRRMRIEVHNNAICDVSEDDDANSCAAAPMDVGTGCVNCDTSSDCPGVGDALSGLCVPVALDPGV